jgi:hypothetical protein
MKRLRVPEANWINGLLDAGKSKGLEVYDRTVMTHLEETPRSP